jgi:hypothetical protein
MRRASWASLLLVATLLPVSVLAHHSFAMFDTERPITLNGVVTEASRPSSRSCSCAGWKSTTLKPGDTVSVTLNPIRTGEPGGIFVSVTLADGRVLGGRAGGSASPPATPTRP